MINSILEYLFYKEEVKDSNFTFILIKRLNSIIDNVLDCRFKDTDSNMVLAKLIKMIFILITILEQFSFQTLI